MENKIQSTIEKLEKFVWVIEATNRNKKRVSKKDQEDLLKYQNQLEILKELIS